MPNFPVPYQMRDWKKVTAGYDSLIFNLNLSGQYLPLIWIDNGTINYPEHNSFGIHTVVGTTVPNSSEGINVLPATVGSSLIGIDKSSQNGYNWVLMCEEYFNKANNAGVYLNHPNGSNWDDWWYDLMPNIFFYQLKSLYPQTGDFQYQFTNVAERWSNAVDTLGASTTPWTVPNMNYRAFNLMTMKPLATGVKEPEASGAIAWILYNAFTMTGDVRYRIRAELSLEFLNSLSTNPSYELQLPYGIYTAARMNAEIGTNYDITKMLNWCFNVGPLRSWGAITGTWGGYDVDGLIGEVNGSNDYAFLMNSFEQVGALVPMVRYDDRFARAIGKWVLNLANASRLFYTNYLPDYKQDSEEWSHQYDSSSYIGHEALRQNQNGVSPYATGDAISGGWGLTNLALYGSSHVGIMGGIIDTTDVTAILKLDLLKTDYYHKDAYPSFLIYNPYSSDKSVTLNVGNDSKNIYDAVSNTIINSAVSGNVVLTLPANQAVIAVIIPAGSAIIFNNNKAVVNNIIIDYNTGQSITNHLPRIKSLSCDKEIIIINDSCKIYCTAADLDNDQLSFSWQISAGSFSGNGAQIDWITPADTGNVLIKCIVNDGAGGIAEDSILIRVTEINNLPPVIQQITAEPRKIHLNSNSVITCSATDPEGSSLIYFWSSDFGSISGTGDKITWTSPGFSGNFYIKCTVTDNNSGVTEDSIKVSVRDTTLHQSGDLVAFYPFNGNANDLSGFNNNGTVNGPILVSDRWGTPSSAYSFDGINDNITVASSSSLNFQNSITLNFWMKIGEFYEREAYPVSHGNWENRWKISLTNKHLRWTVKTTAGVKDLDSETELMLNTLYNVTTIYDGNDFEIYLNGKLDSFTSFSGLILTTPVSLMIGQVLPGNTQYNFKGVLDDIRIYNYALSYNSIQSLIDFSTQNETETLKIPENFLLSQNFPNPFNNQTLLKYEVPFLTGIKIELYNVLGEKIKSLYEGEKNAGIYFVSWDGTDNNNSLVGSGVYFVKFSADEFSDTKKIVLLK